MEGKGIRISKTILENKKKVVGIVLPNMKTYCKARVMKTIYYWQTDRQIGQWNRTGRVEINTYLGTTDFEQRCKTSSVKKVSHLTNLLQ